MLAQIDIGSMIGGGGVAVAALALGYKIKRDSADAEREQTGRIATVESRCDGHDQSVIGQNKICDLRHDELQKTLDRHDGHFKAIFEKLDSVRDLIQNGHSKE